jgi:CO dehydrogenase nickel-insertion accessory protein CooC1
MFIGITGKARSGKDTFAELLANALFNKNGQRFVLMAYAHELKLRVQREFDLSYEQLWGDEKESLDRRYRRPTKPYSHHSEDGELPNSCWTAREILQAYGQFYRTIDYNFWVKALFNIIEDKEYENVIITDVRHPNEADPIVERGGIIIKVTRDSKDKIHGAQHISETAMDDYSPIGFHVINDFGLEELKVATTEVADFILKQNYGGKRNGS